MFSTYVNVRADVPINLETIILQDMVNVDKDRLLKYNHKKRSGYNTVTESIRGEERFSREIKLIGTEAMRRLNRSKVIVFGAGGVGGYVIEALTRAGIGTIDVVDNDLVSESNINRQILACTDTVGMKKTKVAAARIKNINPECQVRRYDLFYSEATANLINLNEYDYIVDAIDTVSSKIFLICRAYEKKINIISSMGTGNKIDPSRFRVADIYKTEMCPLAAVVRRELRKRGIKKLKVVFSDEPPIKIEADDIGGRHIPASISFVPPTAGMIAAGEVICDIAGLHIGRKN